MPTFSALPAQIEDEIASCVEFARDVLKDFGFDKFQTELSTWNPEDKKSFVAAKTNGSWPLILEKVLKKLNIEYKTIPGEAAFYGPKIDIKLVVPSAACGSSQLSSSTFNLPQRFGLEYVAEDGSASSR